MKYALLIAGAVLAACGSDSTSTPPKQDAPTGSGAHDAAKPVDGTMATTDGKSFLDAPPGTFPLTLHNYLSWCNAKVNGGAASVLDQTVNVLPGTIDLSATGTSGFMLSSVMWHHTAGDTSGHGEGGMVTGTGTTASSATTVVVGSAPKCVWVCCPSTTITTDCDNVPDQCP